MRMLILAIVLVSSVAHAGTFSTYESKAAPERKPYTNIPAPVSPVIVDHPELNVRWTGVYRVHYVWSADIRAYGRSHCYTEAHILDRDGKQILWTNANSSIPAHSNGWTTAGCTFSLGHGAASLVSSISVNTTCN